jgi:hypothetical protein
MGAVRLLASTESEMTTEDRGAAGAEPSQDDAQQQPDSVVAASAMQSSPGEEAPTRTATTPERSGSAGLRALLVGAAGGAIVFAIIQGALLLLPHAAEDRNGLAARLAALEATVQASRPAESLASDRLSGIERDLHSMSQNVDALGRQLQQVAAASNQARQVAEATAQGLPDLRQQIAGTTAVATKLAAIETRLSAIEGELRSLATRVAAVEGANKTLSSELAKRTEAENRDRAARFATAAAALGAAVEQGRPFTAELAALGSLAPDPKQLAPLEPFAASGVPTQGALAHELAALTPSLVEEAGPREDHGSFLERLQSNAERLVRIRPLQSSGSDAGGSVMRADAKAAGGDLQGAVADLEQLPAPLRARAAGWIERERARSAALAATRQLAAQALSELSK